ncbi:opioid growth factor receptor-like protein 1 isoform X2 [Syngnathoides biaculeatus]|uniref:opioid growth factor receptor-like protein 1 isoform X2 n=1 Tax=Syngnathoides biaculeatus TaxID=300417 RepID=UPI002ADE4593|nr:opioid growth factor receptor-like protein 1 isoform X2 [Syngnathoides biaculeatus]
MGNLLGNWRLKEPSTVEECDSTWGSDSESEQLAAEEDNGISESVSPVENEWPAGNNGDSPSKNYKKSRQPSEYRNLRFYLNMIPLVPDGIYIEEILTRWRGDYDKLEHNHTYIQWLFPLREQGLNFYAHELTQDEIKEFQSTREAKRRFLAAYSLMLDFYGIKLLDKGGNVARSSNWDERFHHLNESQHNYLRITRILKSLGELGYEAFKAPLVRLFLEESLHHNTLPNMQHSILEYFVYTIRRPSARRRLLRYARQHYRPVHAFLWGPPSKRSKPRSGDGAGAGSSGIRAPAPTPELQRKEEMNFIPASACSGTLVSFHHVAADCLDETTPLGYNIDGLEGPLIMMLGRNDYSEAVTL